MPSIGGGERVNQLEGGMSATAPEVLQAKAMFEAPNGDGGMIRSRQMVKIASDQTSYSSRGTLRFIASSNGKAVDPSTSYMSFKLTVACSTMLGEAKADFSGDPDELLYLPIGCQGLFKTVRTKSWGGTIIEDLGNYNIMAAFRDRLTLRPDDTELLVPGEMWPLNLSSILREKCFPGPQGDGVATGGTGAAPVNSTVIERHDDLFMCAAYAQGLSLSRGVNLTYKVRHSGIWGGEKLILLKHFGQLTLELELDEIQNVFAYWRARRKVVNAAQAAGTNFLEGSYAPDTLHTSAADPVTAAAFAAQLFGPNVNFSLLPESVPVGAGVDINAKVTAYTISEAYLLLDTVELSPSMDQGLDAAVLTGGLPIYFQTYYVTPTPIPARTVGQQSYTINKAVANVTAVTSVQVVTDSVLAKVGGLNYKFFSGGLSSWQYRLGVQYYPYFQVQKESEGLREAMKALPIQGDRYSAIPRQKYSWHNGEMAQIYNSTLSILGVNSMMSVQTAYSRVMLPQIIPTTASTAQTPTLATAAVLHARAQDGQLPDLFVVGVRMQNLPGIMMTGQSTNSGNQLTLECNFEATYSVVSATKTNQEAGVNMQDFARTMYHFVWYARCITIQPNQNVIIKE